MHLVSYTLSLNLQSHCVILFEYIFAAPNDFISTNTQLSFDPDGTHVQCVNISIVGDSTLENNESFLANLTTDDPAIILRPSMAAIDILNDDSKDACFTCPLHSRLKHNDVCVYACID